MMQESGITEIIGCDRRGRSRSTFDYVNEMSGIKRWFAENTNAERVSGGPNEVIEGCDLFIGVSGPGLIDPKSLEKMDKDAMVFAMANPTPEVMPEAESFVRIMAAAARITEPDQQRALLPRRLPRRPRRRRPGSPKR